MRFSKRHGYKEVREQVQVESLDSKTRDRLWNVLHERVVDLTKTYEGIFPSTGFGEFSRAVWTEHLYQRRDEYPSDTSSIVGIQKEIVTGGRWFEVMDFLEFTSQYFSSEELDEKLNGVLEEEKSAYRIVEGEVVPITDEVELESIEEGLERTRKYEGVREHLETALAHFSDEDDPDYRNSVKESISAVESMAQIVVGDKSATLGKALTIMEQKGELNGALKSSFSSLYGYASDQEGIRHALSEQSDVSFAFAKFMLVNCTAFVNYLIDEYEAE
jgi:hypothetical protein